MMQMTTRAAIRARNWCKMNLEEVRKLKLCFVEDNVPLSEAYQEEFAGRADSYECFEPPVEGESATDVAAYIARVAPDYLIIDARLNLKNGSINDGIEVLRCLRHYQHVCKPIVLLVTNSIYEVRPAYKEFNCAARLAKHPDHQLTANAVAEFIEHRPKPPSSPEHFYLEKTSCCDSNSENVEIPANTFAKRIDGEWIHVPISGYRNRAPRLLNELMSRPGSWIKLDALKQPVAPGGNWNWNALTSTAHDVRECFQIFFDPEAQAEGSARDKATQILEDLTERLMTSFNRGALWMPPS
jgi:hypothetical protein